MRTWVNNERKSVEIVSYDAIVDSIGIVVLYQFCTFNV